MIHIHWLVSWLCISEACLLGMCLSALLGGRREVKKEWISVKDKLPESGKFVLCFFTETNKMGKWPRIIIGFYAAPKYILQSDNDDFEEYDETSDEYYLPEGWYECNETEEVHYFVHEKITHWMPLPESPISIWKKEE